MPYGLGCWRRGALWAGLLTTGLSMFALGCHGKDKASVSKEERGFGTKTPVDPANRAAAVISAVCTRQSYATASVGLIAGETKFREDVFELRDPVSYRVVPYRLGATVKLERLLRQDAAIAGRPEAQARCIRQFADHFRGLTDPLVEAAQDEKQIDLSAFKDAEREAQPNLETGKQDMKQQ